LFDIKIPLPYELDVGLKIQYYYGFYFMLSLNAPISLGSVNDNGIKLRLEIPYISCIF
jgi:hypothetical protein